MPKEMLIKIIDYNYNIPDVDEHIDQDELFYEPKQGYRFFANKYVPLKAKCPTVSVKSYPLRKMTIYYNLFSSPLPPFPLSFVFIAVLFLFPLKAGRIHLSRKAEGMAH